MDQTGDEHAGLDLHDILAAVNEFGAASLGLVAWEYMVAEHVLEPFWDQAIEQQFLQPQGQDAHGDETFSLTLLGRAHLDELDKRRRAG